MPKVKIDAAGRITLSPELLAHLGIEAGSQLEIEKVGGSSLLVHRARKAGSIADVFGFLKDKAARTVSIDEMNEAISKGWAGEP